MADAREQPRYRFLRALGRGGMGRVSLVWDEDRGEEVALKRITVPGAGARVDFKREFRRVERLLHPGLVRLHELGEDDEGLFFTMEALDGTTLLEYCRGIEGDLADSRETTAVAAPGGPPDSSSARHAPTELATGTPRSWSSGGDDADVVAPGQFEPARLAEVLPGILEALSFLHAHGLVHRDLKPGNVMVDRGGAPRLLDFGILAQLGAEAGKVAGTPGYMAPEQIRGEPAEPSSDCYALGATLFELVAGRRPFLGETTAVLYQQLEHDPPALDELAEAAPAALVQACGALLDRVPVHRPGLAELARTLLPALGARGARLEEAADPALDLLGRDALAAALEQRLAAAPGRAARCVVLCGPTGVGKSALLGWTVEAARRRGMVVLQGRGRPSERVPFNAVDGAIDDLSARLEGCTGELAEQARTAASAFPVLQPAGQPPAPSDTPRPAAFRALSGLLAAQAADRGLLLVVDDVQWADADAVALLDHLTRARPPGVLLLLSLRDDVEASRASRWIERSGRAERIAVPELEDAEIAAIVARMARATGVEPGSRQLSRAVAESRGRPFFAEVAGRVLGRADPDRGPARGTVASLIEPLPEASRALLAAIAATDGWTPVADLADVLGRIPGVLVDDLRSLELDGLIRRTGPPSREGRVDLYHDQVRVAVHELLGEEAVRRAHAAFADALVAREDADPLRRIHHLLGAGEVDEAARRARVAAAVAEGRHAHDLAATLYRVAADNLAEERAELLERRARALERAARYVEAADCWRELAELDPERRVDATLSEAHALFAADRIGDARRRLDVALHLEGEGPLRDAWLPNLAAGGRFLLGPGRPRTRAGGAADSAELRRAERDVRVAIMLLLTSPLTGLRYTRSARDRFDRHGAREQAAWCDYLFAHFALMGTRYRGMVPLAERYLSAARARLGGPPSNPELRAMEPWIAGLEASREGRWAEARTSIAQAVGLLERGGLRGTYLHLLAMAFLSGIDLYSEDLPRFRRSHQRFEDITRDSLHTAMHGQVEGSAVALAVYTGEIEEARERVEAYLAAHRDDAPNVYSNTLEVASTLPDIYTRDCHAARRRIAASLRRHRAQRPWNHMFVRTIAGLAALAEVNACRTGDRDASLRAVEHFARRAHRSPPLFVGATDRARAYAADQAGQPGRALALLQRAEEQSRRHDLRISAAIARYQRGLRLGGDEGDTLCREAREEIESIGGSARLLDEDAGRR